MNPARRVLSQTRMVHASVPDVSETATLGDPVREGADHRLYEPLQELYRPTHNFVLLGGKKL
jgi:hypothetical protein